MNRRSMLLGAALSLPALALLGGCSTGNTLAEIKSYAATAVAALTAVVPLVDRLDPAIAGQLDGILVDAQAAEKALAALTTPTGASGIATTLLQLLNEGFSIAEAVPGIPTPYVLGISAAQILLVAIASFFGISATAANEMAMGVASRSAGYMRAVGSNYAALTPSGRKQYADAAKAQVQAFVSSLSAAPPS